MPDTIKSGVGNGYLVEVTKNNKLRAYCTNESEISYESETNGQAYTWSNVSYNYTAGDTILLIKNTSATKNLLIQTVAVSGDTATTATIHLPNCTTPTGTVVTGVNLNRQSGNTAEATAKADETTNTQANIITTILINGSTTMRCPVEGAIVLGLNDCIAVDFTTDGGAANVTVRGYYHEVC